MPCASRARGCRPSPGERRGVGGRLDLGGQFAIAERDRQGNQLRRALQPSQVAIIGETARAGHCVRSVSVVIPSPYKNP